MRLAQIVLAASRLLGLAVPAVACAVEWWMNSSKHRDNNWLRSATDVGIGIAVSDAPDNKLPWTLVFHARK